MLAYWDSPESATAGGEGLVRAAEPRLVLKKFSFSGTGRHIFSLSLICPWVNKVSIPLSIKDQDKFHSFMKQFSSEL